MSHARSPKTVLFILYKLELLKWKARWHKFEKTHAELWHEFKNSRQITSRHLPKLSVWLRKASHSCDRVVEISRDRDSIESVHPAAFLLVMESQLKGLCGKRIVKFVGEGGSILGRICVSSTDWTSNFVENKELFESMKNSPYGKPKCQTSSQLE